MTIYLLTSLVLVAIIINYLSLIGYRKNCYNRAFYGAKLLQREDLTDTQRKYIQYLVDHKNTFAETITLIFRVPKKILSKNMELKVPTEIGDIWKDSMFDKFVRSDMKVFFKRHPFLSAVLLVTVLVFGVLKLILAAFSNLSFKFPTVEDAYEENTVQRFMSRTQTAR